MEIKQEFTKKKLNWIYKNKIEVKIQKLKKILILRSKSKWDNQKPLENNYGERTKIITERSKYDECNKYEHKSEN